MNMRLEVLVSDSKELRMSEFPAKFHEMVIEASKSRNILCILYPEGLHYIPAS